MDADQVASRYRSRILREMNANRENPFNSPPSSTGSHGTVSPTMSSVFSDPDGESTRKLNDDIARLTGQKNGRLQVNWDAAHKQWPDYYKPTQKASRPVASGAMPDHNKLTRALEARDSVAPKYLAQYLDDSTQNTWQDSRRTRAEMQPRVDNDSDHSIKITRSPERPDFRPESSRFAHQPRTRSPLSRASMRQASGDQFAAALQPSVREQVDRFDHIQNAQALAATPKVTSAPSMAAKHTPVDFNTIRKTFPSPAATDSPANNVVGGTLNSFLMPDISHLNDLVSGTLRFNGAYKNGVPIFVKHGKVRDQAEALPHYDHAEVDGIVVPGEEEKIFVSMDAIRKEIEDLQEHDDMVQKYANDLHEEVDKLRRENKHLKSRNSVDSAIGSRTASEPETAAHERLITEKLVLESQVASLRSELDQVSRRVGVSEVENNTLSVERDRAIKKLQEACENIGELMDKLDRREHELSDTQKKLDLTLQLQTTQTQPSHGGGSEKHDDKALQLENQSLRADNNTLRREKQTLQEELESLRADNNSLRREYESLMTENRSLRGNARTLMTENEELRQNGEGSQQELNALREEVEVLQQDLEVLEQDKTTLKEDNESLVRHNEKYFDENKMLRRENSGFERSIHDLHDENLRLKEEVEFLKQQLDHCRPIGKDDDFSVRLGHDDFVDEPEEKEEEEGMTSAFFVPDITIDENSIIADATSDSNKAPPKEDSRPIEIADSTAPTDLSVEDPEQIVDVQKAQAKATKDQRASKDLTSQGQKVAFSLPDDTQNSKTMANQGSKRRTASHMTYRSSAKGSSVPVLEAYRDDSTILSPGVTQDMSVSMDFSKPVQAHETTSRSQVTRDRAGTITQDLTSHSRKGAATKSSMKSTHQRSATVDATPRARRDAPKSNCPALSPDARRVLDGLCEHKCKNCVVCSRISGHRGTVSAREAAEGKKRVQVSKPVPVTDVYQQHGVYSEEPTMRPSQHPGHALAMVIKGLEDEATHMKMELSQLQARYNVHDSSLGKRERKELASDIKQVLRRLEVKNDQIYALYDVLEGQKQAGQAMSDDELEMTVFSLTGISVRDVSQNLTFEGLMA